MGLGDGLGKAPGDEAGPDLELRDPKGINTHIKVAFDDVLSEPESVRSGDCAWRTSYKCFNCCKNCCYRCLTDLCGSCLALLWGIHFACLAFHHIWCFTPCLHSMTINYGCCKKFWEIILQCCLEPVCDTFGKLFSSLKDAMN